MEVEKRKRYSKEYKEDVVNLIKTGDKSISEISKELQIPIGTLYRWYKRLNGSNNPKEVEISEKDKELRALRKKLADVEEERDILKKAISIFSKEGKNPQRGSYQTIRTSMELRRCVGYQKYPEVVIIKGRKRYFLKDIKRTRE